MSVFKELSPNEFKFREFPVYKEWVFTQVDTGSVVMRAIQGSGSFGFNGGAYDPLSEATNSNGIYQRTLYDSVKWMYYNLISRPYGESGSFALYPYYDNYSVNDPNLIHKNFHDKCTVVSIHDEYIGDTIKAGTVLLEDTTIGFELYDDGNGNLYDGRCSASFTVSQSEFTVGNIFYEHGVAVITNTGSYSTAITPPTGSVSGALDPDSYLNFGTGSNNYSVKFRGTHNIYEYEAYCISKPGEFTYTMNPSAVSGALDGGLYWNFITGSEFTTYVTTVGLYDDQLNLIAVGKLNQPVRNDPDMALTFVVRFDL